MIRKGGIIKKKLYGYFIFTLLFFGIFSQNVFAMDTISTQEQVLAGDKVDDYVYDMIEDYENGVFVERNDLETLEMSKLFVETNIYSADTENVIYLYDNREIGNNTYAATQISISKNEQDDGSDIDSGVKAVCVIVYNLMDMGDAFDYIMLVDVKGAILYENDDYNCTKLQLGYEVRGDAYDEDGNRYGMQGEYSSLDKRTIYDPLVGFYYLQTGPRDYYYCMGAYGALVAGYLSADIENSAGDTKYLWCNPGFEAI